jgi:subtilase family serine protease
MSFIKIPSGRPLGYMHLLTICFAALLGLTRNAKATYTPAQIRTAYGFNGITFGSTPATGAGETIAIVDAYNNPTIKTDLTTFDSDYGISVPPSFTVENETGGSSLPTGTNSGWTLESDLDVEWAHAIAPMANIVLVETTSNSYFDLDSGVQTAAGTPGVCVVSNSWGSVEYSGETGNDFNFKTPANHQGVCFVACTGDSGSPWWPSAAPTVLAVGGTALSLRSNGTYVSENAWNDSYGSGGGGISTQETEPTYQEVAQQTGFRTVPDVSYDAAGSTPIDAVVGGENYYVYGTSCGAPQWAALIALADQGRALDHLPTLDSSNLTTGLMPMLYDLYDTPYYDEAFNDVTTGTTSTGQAAGVGYDTATGLGTPKAGFLVPYLAGEISIPEPQGKFLVLLAAAVLPLMGRFNRIRRSPSAE